MAFRFWTAENLSQRLPGGATQVATDVFEDVTSDDILQEVGELSSPFALIAPIQVEGTDLPFYTRQQIDEPENWLRTLDEWDLYLPETGAGSWPLTTLSVAPDPEPLFIALRASTNQEEVLHDWADLDARFPFDDFSRWFLPFELGGTVYGDNLCRLLSEIQRHLLEDPIDNGLTWSLWTRDEVVNLVNQRINRFLNETGLTRRRNTVAVVAGQSLVEVPEDVIQIRRIAWLDGNGRQMLPKIEPWALDNSDQTWEENTGTPRYYVEQPMPARKIVLSPTPNGAGILEVFYVAAPVEVDNCDPIPVPMMWVPYIKYGVMSDMLSKEGEANDPERALHFELRWDEGIELARNFLGINY